MNNMLMACGGTSIKNTVNELDPFNDGSGIVLYKLDGDAFDESGNYDGTWSGTEAYSAGKFGDGGKFAGGSCINTEYKTQDLVDNKSFSLWIKADPADNDDRVEFFGWRYDNNRGSFSVYWSKIDDELMLISSGGSDARKIIYSDFNTIANNWNHIAGVFKDGTQTLYINGEKIGTTDLGIEGTTNYNIFIGHGYNNRDLNGLIDQVRIFNRPLTDTEVASLYTETT